MFSVLQEDTEVVYQIPVTNTNKRIVVRSTINPRTNIADGTGQDSIRVWVEYRFKNGWYALGKDDVRWTTRVNGWEKRLDARIRDAWKLAVRDSKKRARVSELKETRDKSLERIQNMLTETKTNDLDVFAEFAQESQARRADKNPEIPNCPKCNTQMVKRERRSDGQSFWGCPDFPKCRGTRRFEIKMLKDIKKSIKKFKPSPLQRAIYEFVQNGDGHGVVDAKAGSGKTTTNIGCLEFTDKNSRVSLLAFNRHIAREQAEKAPPHVDASTFHSLCLANVRKAFPNVEVETNKNWKLLDDYRMDIRTDSEFLAIEESKSDILRLVSLCKGMLLEPTDDNLNFLIDRFGMIVELQHSEFVLKCARWMFETSVKEASDGNRVDFDDMIYLCAAEIVSCQKYDFLIVDEAQDLNPSQIKVALLSIKTDGRIICTGDEFQSMYGFRGADADAMPNIIKALNPTILPLSITYRCPKSVVRLVNERFPKIEFAAADNAIEGTVLDTTEERMLSRAKSGDLVLCRTNAPLVAPCFALLRRGQKAVIRGRDIGKGLVTLIKKIQKRTSVYNLDELLDEMQTYERRERSKLLKLGKTSQAAQLQDQVETVIAMSDGIFTIQELTGRIESVFTDKDQGVVFSSIHRAKGDESDTVFILEPGLLPHPLASQPWELQQEKNIEYVAITRTKNELFFVY
jgi:DNA helicase-2/ATP-dependent DNA helicase PcrA